MCPPQNGCRCKVLPYNEDAVVCCNVDSFFLVEGLHCSRVTSGRIVALHIINATIDELNLSRSEWKRLKSLAITNGKIRKIVGQFARYTTISCLNFSANSLIEIQSDAFYNLYNLNTLDLSSNNLSVIPNFSKNKPIKLDVSGSSMLLCKHLLEIIGRNIVFLNGNDTFCQISNTYNWFNSTDLVPLEQMNKFLDSWKDCSNCSCNPYGVDIVPGKPPTLTIIVDCSFKQLISLPEKLPPNTISLNVSFNKITSLKQMSLDSSYKNIRELDADNNKIESILGLEGTQFLDQFTKLSLRNNSIRSIPTYMLSNTFERATISRDLLLSYNKLYCDCNAAQVLKVWLLSKKNLISDYNKITCDNLPVRIIDLDVSEMCQNHEQEWINYVYLIICFEVFLLVSLFCKVTYDYCVFKRTGYLPWPANKLPKLPCDCLCESWASPVYWAVNNDDNHNRI